MRTLKNSGQTAIRVDYYQLMRKWRVDLFRYGLRMTYDLAVPSPGQALLEIYDEIRRIGVDLGRELVRIPGSVVRRSTLNMA